MSKSLWSEVLEGTFNTEGQTDTSYEAEVESVTDEAESMVGYVAGCTEAMLAVQTAVATMEGRCAVQYVRGETEQATATMEGVIRNAWETLKEWVKKAYAAIKKFLKKAWNKMKGYINVFKAMVTKYNYILKGKVDGNLKIDWVDISMEKGAAVAKKALDDIDHADNALKSYDNNKEFHDALEKAFFGEKGRTPYEAKWKDKGAEAIRVADDGFDKVYSEAFKLGEMTERETLKDINEATQKSLDQNEKLKSEDTRNERNNSVNSKARRKTNVMRTYSAMVNTAASLKVRLAVKACRKAIRNQAENSSATFGVESTDFSAVMGEIL